MMDVQHKPIWCDNDDDVEREYSTPTPIAKCERTHKEIRLQPLSGPLLIIFAGLSLVCENKKHATVSVFFCDRI